MRGSIYQKKTNKKWYPYIYDKETNKKKWGTGHTSKRDAEIELRQMLSQFDTGTVVFGRADRYEAILNEFIETVVPEKYKSMNEQKSCSYMLRKHTEPFFKTRVDKITSKDIQRLLHNMRIFKSKAEPEVIPSAATKKKLYNYMNALFQSANDWGQVSINPCEGITLKSPVQVTPDTWSSDDVNYFLSLDEVHQSDCYLGFLILATTGLSRSEAAGLQWKDFHGDYFILEQGKDVYMNSTNLKTSFRRRKVEIMPSVRAALEAHRERQDRISKMLVSAPDINTWILTDDFNQPFHPDRYTKTFKRIIENNNKNSLRKLPVIPLKNLRHTFATLLINDDVNIKIVQEALGHSKTSTTQNFYQGAAQKSMHRTAVLNLQNEIFKVSVENPVEKIKKA
ncbi:MAG: site-specific integrase [Eubacteriales bacterium]|nr:site-specific integrase [Eubacteriales bacterium]